MLARQRASRRAKTAPPGGGAVFWRRAAPLLALALAVRLVGLAYGLPHVYNADEPHLLHMAVSLSAGLRPYSFKYPTLWPEVLAAAFGAWFAFWSGAGLARGASAFAALYAFHPTGFYLIARGLAAVCQIGGLAAVARAETRGGARLPWGAALLALSPTLVESAHSAKPDSLMFLLSAASIALALEFLADGKKSRLMGSAFLAGLACSAQYTAAPAGLAVGCAWLLGEDGPAPWPWLWQAGAAAAAGFLLGTPYALIDHSRFAADWRDYAALGRLRDPDAPRWTWAAVKNIWAFAGEGTIGGLAALLGAAALLRREPKRALVLLVPIAAYAAVLTFSFDGGVPRYLMGAFAPLALLAGEGLSSAAGEIAWRRALTAALALIPGLILCASMDADFLAPDTRAQAGRWLAAHVPAHDTLLLDEPHAGPLAPMDLEQCKALAARTAALGSPRARLYAAMAAHHPGGGWRVLRVRRSAADLWSAPGHVARSQADGDFLDVRPGLDVARAARVDYVVTSSYGADPERARELATFFQELYAGADLVAEFRPVPEKVVGPWLRVFRLAR